jgi:hypothetical protein
LAAPLGTGPRTRTVGLGDRLRHPPAAALIGGAGAALPPLITGDSGQTAIAVADRTGGWTGHLGDRRSRGPLDVTMACLDDGQIEVRATYGASLTVSCNGTLQGMHDETAPTGPVTVTVRPAALDHRWSIRVSRGRRGG